MEEIFEGYQWWDFALMIFSAVTFGFWAGYFAKKITKNDALIDFVQIAITGVLFVVMILAGKMQ